MKEKRTLARFLDIEKVYDRVTWEVLCKVLEKSWSE